MTEEGGKGRGEKKINSILYVFHVVHTSDIYILKNMKILGTLGLGRVLNLIKVVGPSKGVRGVITYRWEWGTTIGDKTKIKVVFDRNRYELDLYVPYYDMYENVDRRITVILPRL